MNNNYQVFELFSEKPFPGFNEMIDAAKSFGNRAHKVKYNGYSTLKKTWTDRLCQAIKNANIIHIDKLFIYMIWHEKSKRRDPDNIVAFAKFILDSLQQTNVIKKDNWAHIKGIKNTFVYSDRSGVVVRLYDTTKNKPSNTKI